jgi:hypothetical protein
MTDFDLLTAVQPNDGWFAVVGLKDGHPPKQVLVASREEVEALAEMFVSQGRNAFFGVAKFATDKGRTKDNVKSLKSFWLDLDCGENKPYADQMEGAEALHKFFKHIGLPRPVLVDSGRGIHAYWPLVEAISIAEWEPICSRLKQLCNIHKLYADPACFEAARVLRIPGTYNFKGEEPLKVTVVNQGAPATPVAEFKRILGVEDDELSRLFGTPKRREMSYLQKKAEDNNEYHFERILKRSLDGTGCNQLKLYYENKESADYDSWFRALTVASACKDRETAIHTVSDGHSEYDPALTEQKAAGLSFATGCIKFEEANPEGCADCPHKGRISSPKRLGIVVPEATEDDSVIITEAADGEVETFVVPSYPDPYYRGKNGGIYRRPAANEESDPIYVYENDLYVVKRLWDPEDGDVILIHLHMPTDGLRKFFLSAGKLYDDAEIRKVLASRGVVANKTNFKLIVDYIQMSVKYIQNTHKAEHMRMQFGWADNESKFIVGDVEYNKDGDFHSPPSTITKNIAAQLGPVGDFDKWKEVFNLYGRAGLEPNAFAALTAFGAPLLRFLGQSGALINIIHPTSGTGKTTILHMCNSVWGNPARLCATKDDTLNAKIMRLGVMNNLPLTVDEMTNMKAEEFSTLIYGISQGRGKDRVKASSNELRANNTTWQTIALCSSNASFYEKLTTLKKSPDGEMMRLIEYKISPSKIIDAELAKAMFDHQLLNNYGHAGPIYARWLINNLEEAKDALLSLQAKIDRELQLTSRERFWSALLAANLAGGLIAKRIGLLDWNMKNVYEYATTLIADSRNDVKAPVNDTVQVVGDYINRHIQNILVVDDGVDRRSKEPQFPKREPKGELLIRYEPDTKRLFLVANAFKADCVRHQISYKETIESLKQKGLLIDTTNKRIGKGLPVNVPGVSCHILDASNPDFIDMSGFAEAEDASGER